MDPLHRLLPRSLLYVCAPAPFQHACADGVEQLPPAFYTALATDHLAQTHPAHRRPPRRRPHPAHPRRRLLHPRRNTGSTASAANAAEKSRDLLARTGVASVAGSAFFRARQSCRRRPPPFLLRQKDADLQEACRRLRTLIATKHRSVITDEWRPSGVRTQAFAFASE